MSLAMKEVYHEKKSVSKKDFEKGYMDLMNHIRIIDQKLSTKADEVVLTMTLAHRQEIEELQTEVMNLHAEVKRLKQEIRTQETKRVVSSMKSVHPFRNWFKKMQFARK
ncbi:hypothetical protein [Aquibacillus rhizosphaerae]|uniref:Uncharacterized protein n=1 Tax=Aquibacillus rhizosphaerae TaxID=3051431 RepID=A0ABT7L4Q2_9BACI|nr:hypothetical protein [Aquibacillus sp. LR5S19]MDL4840841.1 hypothetical protein [Aquibacillus sp. LR5S19]